jgi:hypothetical protein
MTCTKENLCSNALMAASQQTHLNNNNNKHAHAGTVEQYYTCKSPIGSHLNNNNNKHAHAGTIE